LTEQAEAVQKHAMTAVREINTLVQAQDLIERANGWLDENSSLLSVRVAGLRNRRETAAQFLNSIGVVLKKTQLSELDEARRRLQQFVSDTKAAEKRFVDRASELWDRQVTPNDIEEMLSESRDLETAFEGCDADVKDFRLMRRALSLYRDGYATMCDKHLPADRFVALRDELLSRAQSELASDAPPWMPNDVIPVLHEAAAAMRESWGAGWLASMEDEVSRLESGQMGEATGLFNRLELEPAYLNEGQREKARGLKQQVRNHLSHMKVDWLAGEYRGLDDSTQQRFLREIGVR
jgi:hypothetical protein